MQVLLQVLVSLNAVHVAMFFFIKELVYRKKINLELVLQEKLSENKYAIDRGSNVCVCVCFLL